MPRLTLCHDLEDIGTLHVQTEPLSEAMGALGVADPPMIESFIEA